MTVNEDKAHLRLLAEDVTGVAKIFAVTPDGEQYELDGIVNANIDFTPGTVNVLNLEIRVHEANIVTLHRPGMR